MSRTRKRKPIILRTTDRPRPASRPAPVPIIVELAADGSVSVYGPSHLRPFIFNRLLVDSATLATMAEQYHAMEMPKSHRPFYCPRHLLTSELVRARTVEAESDRLWELIAIRAFREGAAVLSERRAGS